MYLAHKRSNLSYALSIIRQFMHNPREQHMNAIYVHFEVFKVYS